MKNSTAFTYSGGALLPVPLPWYAVNEKNPSDSLFTKPKVAARCYATFREVAKQHDYNLRQHVFLEPAAGNGCFLKLLPSTRRIALDIHPRNSDIIQTDFLEWSPAKGIYAVIGNPPFGVRGAIALAFLNRAAIFADIVGFILPMTFASCGKGAAMTRVQGLYLLHSEELQADAFYDAEKGDDKQINTVFQVWGSRKPKGNLAPIKSCDSFVDLFSVSTYHSRRCGLTRMDEYDFFIQGTFYDNSPPQIVTRFDEVKYGSGYGVIIKKQKSRIMAAMKKVDWLKYASRATNHCYHTRMQHIRQAVIDAGFSDD